MTPRFKGDPKKFDLSLPCPLCGHKIQPYELVRLATGEVRCCACKGVFDPMAGKRPQSTS